MKKTILAAFVIVILLVAAILIIPNLDSMGHKEISKEQSQENFEEYSSKYHEFANDNDFEFEASSAGDISSDGSYSQYYTLTRDNEKFNVIVSNSSGYETVTVRYAATYTDGVKSEINEEMYSEITLAYNLLGAVEIDLSDVEEVANDGISENEDVTETVKKCGDNPTQIEYIADDGSITLSGITQNCKKD